MLRKAVILLLMVISPCLFQTSAFALTLTSTAFAYGSMVPGIYTCDGKDISPDLQWSDAPPGTKSFALIMSDIDVPAGTWDHWVLFNIPAQVHALKENDDVSTSNILSGKNSWGRTVYNGPCPPSGVHRYFFKLYALNEMLTLRSAATKVELEAAMKGHILATTELMGKYQKNHAHG